MLLVYPDCIPSAHLSGHLQQILDASEALIGQT